MKKLWILSLCLALTSIGWAQARIPEFSRWFAYGNGFTIQQTGALRAPALYCNNPNVTDVSGGGVALTLNQTTPTPLLISGYSRAQNVSGFPDSNYSLYADVQYSDGSYLYGVSTPFDTGTHGWQKKSLLIWPSKPIATILIYALFRSHSGTVWFSDIKAEDFAPGSAFDGQIQPAPNLGARKSGWFVREWGSKPSLNRLEDVGAISLRATRSQVPEGDQVTLSDQSGLDRFVTLYYCEKLDVKEPLWWPSVRKGEPVRGQTEGVFANIGAGSNSLMSTYPYAAITSKKESRMISISPYQGPAIYRLFYDSSTQMLVAAFDFALTRKSRHNPGTAKATVFSSAISRVWGLRDAARVYYAKFPGSFRKRVTTEGIWIPFTNPATVTDFQDFGFGFHEGDNSVASDAAAGILSFRYSEPMSWWMPMDPLVPRTYEQAIALAQSNLSSPDPSTRRQAEALFSSGTKQSDGRYNVEFRNEPWANGAVWVLNPNPNLPVTYPLVNKAKVVYDLADAQTRYSTTQLSGEYLDSLESWAEIRDYSPDSLRESRYTPTFVLDHLKPFIPQWFSTFEITKLMSDDLRRRGRFLMANTTPYLRSCYMPLVDIAGKEVNWNPANSWSPEPDERMLYWRTLSYHKPYALLMNTNFSDWSFSHTEKYIKRCLAYAIYPSMFSQDAATNVYWENPTLYNRDRPLFVKYVPLIRQLSLAGWQPVTYARASDPEVFVERYGVDRYTVFNPSSSSKTFTLRVQNLFAGRSQFFESVQGVTIPATVSGSDLVITLTLGPEEVAMLKTTP